MAGEEEGGKGAMGDVETGSSLAIWSVRKKAAWHACLLFLTINFNKTPER